METLAFEKYFHIYNHANGDDNLFREERNFHFFLEKYEQHIQPIADTIVWCLMPNHFHLLVKIKSEGEIASTFPKFRTLEKLEARSNFLSKQFANFFSSYTQAFNKVYGRRGSLFMKNFKQCEIRDDDYLRNLVIYIHLNPVKRGFTKNVGDWKWTSYDNFPDTHPALFTLLFDNRENYHSMHRLKQSFFSEYDRLEDELT